jgi:hypothetical protein
MLAALLVYAAGVLVGLGVMRDRFASRLVTALLWPLGPLAGLVVITGLLVVAVALWPGPMLAGAAAVGVLVYLLA